uniref:CD274 molecule n=1 Tax=Lepisosteus oculatus TaxID=7918 RepID=W5MVF8_LEPOC
MDNSLLIIFQVAMWPMFPALFTVDMTESSFLAEFRGNVTMECRFPTGGGETLSSLRVYWHRILPEPLLEVYKLESGKEDLSTQHPRYKGRVNLQKDRLKQGQAVLQMSNLTISDSGKYRCIVEQGGADYKEATLNVRAPYRNIKTAVTGKCQGPKGHLELSCEAEGFPLADVQWTDMSGHSFNTTTTTHKKNEEGLFIVKSYFKVKAGCGDIYNCTFKSGTTNEETSASLLFMDMNMTLETIGAHTSLELVVPLIVGLVLLLLLCPGFLFIMKRKRSKCFHSAGSIEDTAIYKQQEEKEPLETQTP